MRNIIINFLRLGTIIVFSNIILPQSSIFASNMDIPKKELTISMDKVEWKNSFENEIKKLNKRIEVLEHDIQLIKKHNIGASQEKGIKNKTSTEKSIFDLTNNDKPTSEKKPTAKDAVKEERKLYELALAALKEKKYDEARKFLNDYIKKNPNNPLLSNAYYWYAESYVRQSDHDSAAINYLKGYKLYPKGEKAADSLLKLALSLEKLGKKEEARQILIKLKEEFPKRSASQIKVTEDALKRIGNK